MILENNAAPFRVRIRVRVRIRAKARVRDIIEVRVS